MNSGRERTPRGAAQPAASSAPQSGERNDWIENGWMVVEGIDADTKACDNDPETLAIFMQQFGLRDGTTDASTSAAPVPKRMPSCKPTSTVAKHRAELLTELHEPGFYVKQALNCKNVCADSRQ